VAHERQSFILPQLQIGLTGTLAIDHILEDLRRQIETTLRLLAARIDTLAGVRGEPTLYADLHLQGNRIMHVGAATEDTDAVQRQQTLYLDQQGQMFDARGRAIQNLPEAIEDTQAVILGQLTRLMDTMASGNPTYIVVTNTGALTQERALAVEPTVLTLTDGGANSSITVSVVTNGITFAKIQQISTDRLIGRDTAGTGNLEQLTVGNGLEFTGAGGIGVADNGITDARLRDSAAVSIIGRSANSSGDPADISASANDQALMRQADALTWATPTAGTHSFWVPAQAMTPSTTAGATMSHLEMATNDNNFITLTFADTGTPEYAEFQMAMPSKWDEGTLTYAVYWTVNSVSTNSAVFGLQAVAMSNDDALDVAFGTAIEVSDAGLGTAYDLHVSATSAAMTVAGSPTAGDLVAFRFYRDSGDGSDTLAASVELIGIKVFWVTTASTDV